MSAWKMHLSANEMSNKHDSSSFQSYGRRRRPRFNRMPSLDQLPRRPRALFKSSVKLLPGQTNEKTRQIEILQYQKE